MAPEIATFALKDLGRSRVVLDPMAGSGTSLVAAKLQGQVALGFDTDPLAVTLANAWCNPVREGLLLEIGGETLREAQKRFWTLGSFEISRSPDEETNRFIRYWFDSVNARQLRCLSEEVRKVADRNLQNQLWCAFSRLIVRKHGGASRAMDLPHSRPHRRDDLKTTKPFSRFMIEVRRVAEVGAHMNERRQKGVAHIQTGDARSLPLPDSSVDLVITSPPYLNAIDYMRAHKFSLIWMGFTVGQLRELRAQNIGTEAVGSLEGLTEPEGRALASMGDVRTLPGRHRRIIARYLRDLSRVVDEISRVLRVGGKAVLVIGDSTIRGVFIRNSAALDVLAQSSGMRLRERTGREIVRNRRYLPPPDDSGDSDLKRRMGCEVVMTLVRV